MNIAIVKYNAGNIQSVTYALERLGIQPQVTDSEEHIRAADKVIFPGVGEASTAMEYLKARKLDLLLKDLKQPFLGICLGMQLMCRHSEENDTPCLGIFDADVKQFPPEEKVPHMGWNTIREMGSPLLKGLDEETYVYFVHSYYANISPDTTCSCRYVLPFSAGLRKDNYHAFQFHPEKSGPTGEQILKNFLEL